MKIGLLAYHAACNFGAFLQLLSTVEYVKKQGDEPLVINWIPSDFQRDYEKRSLPDVREKYSELRKKYYPLTELCETDKDVAATIVKNNLDAVIIGSDAVLQHHPFRERFHFPTRRIFYLAHPTSDRMYPNCFWGTFNRHLEHPVPVAMISGSSQDSQYKFIWGRVKRRMNLSIRQFKYLSVRDSWTSEMVSYLTDGDIVPQVTPDPVFAFNQNAQNLQLKREDVLKKYKLPENYILISFKSNKSVSQDWISAFEHLAAEKGLFCVRLPYADSRGFGKTQYNVGVAISPLEWYALIKYSKGYVGNNMHPIVTSIHNGVPFFSFDNYGIASIGGKPTNGESSKIYHLLHAADLLEYRVFTKQENYSAPMPDRVLQALTTFKIEKECSFALMCQEKYNKMMKEVYQSISPHTSG